MQEKKKKAQEREIKKKQIIEKIKDAAWLEGVDPNSKAYDLLLDLAQSNKDYEDPEFPPNTDSISKNSSHSILKKVNDDAEWRRIHKILDIKEKKVNLFDGVEPNDIKAGCLGASYCLASLAAIAEFPDRLEKCFLTP